MAQSTKTPKRLIFKKKEKSLMISMILILAYLILHAFGAPTSPVTLVQKKSVRRPSFPGLPPPRVLVGLPGGSPEAEYFGGPVMTNPVKLYIIYYGSWTSEQIQTIQTFLSNIGKSEWYNINRKYYKTDLPAVYNSTHTENKIYISDHVKIEKTIQLNGAADDADLLLAAKNQDFSSYFTQKIETNEFPIDTDGVYMFLSSSLPSVDNPQLLQNEMYCGIHHHYSRDNQHLKWFYAGLDTNDQGCGVNVDNSVNGNMDGILSTIAHELVETTSDPLVNEQTAWGIPQSGKETADMCEEFYGAPLNPPGESVYNVIIGEHKYYIQGNFDPEDRVCKMGIKTQEGAIAPSQPQVTNPSSDCIRDAQGRCTHVYNQVEF